MLIAAVDAPTYFNPGIRSPMFSYTFVFPYPFLSATPRWLARFLLLPSFILLLLRIKRGKNNDNYRPTFLPTGFPPILYRIPRPPWFSPVFQAGRFEDPFPQQKKRSSFIVWCPFWTFKRVFGFMMLLTAPTTPCHGVERECGPDCPLF